MESMKARMPSPKRIAHQINIVVPFSVFVAKSVGPQGASYYYFGFFVIED
jgi:hypothetical protein